MKELNKLLEKLDKQCPHATNKIETYGTGKIIQIIVGDINTKTFKVDQEKLPGVYTNETDTVDIIEVLYKTNAERKKFAKQLMNTLKEKLDKKIVFTSVISETDDTLLIQLYALDALDTFKF